MLPVRHCPVCGDEPNEVDRRCPRCGTPPAKGASIAKGEAERLATRLEAEEAARRGDFRYTLIDCDLLQSVITFLRTVEGDYALSRCETLLAALGTVTRMRVMPDDKVNRITLAAAIELAERTLSAGKGTET